MKNKKPASDEFGSRFLLDGWNNPLHLRKKTV